jgi:hypothetical protein
MATYFVTSSGSDSNAGTSEANAFATPGRGANVLVSGDTLYIKEGSYLITTNTLGPGGPVMTATGNRRVLIAAYRDTPGDNLGYATIAMEIGSVDAVKYSGTSIEQAFSGLKINGNGQTGVTAFAGHNSTACTFSRCIAENCNIAISGIAFIYGFTAIGCATPNDNSANTLIKFAAIDCTNPILVTLSGRAINCLSVRSGGDGFSLQGNASRIANCTAIEAAGNGFTAANRTLLADCVAWGCGGYGFSGGTEVVFVNLAAGGNASGNFNGFAEFSGDYSLLESPYVDIDSLDLRLKPNTAGNTLLSKGIGFFGVTGDSQNIGGLSFSSSSSSLSAGFTGIRGISRRLGT